MTGWTTFCGACGNPMRTCQCCTAPVAGALSLISVPPPVLPPATRFTLRYGVMICTTCGLAKDYCKGHAPAAPPAQDGAESNLIARIRECTGTR